MKMLLHSPLLLLLRTTVSADFLLAFLFPTSCRNREFTGCLAQDINSFSCKSAEIPYYNPSEEQKLCEEK
eukprot:snap_masked-scaffold_13-processed-gene-3.51-mRNA-1 protein AED:1.00 eAED:1.00 QI:0/0/0/0/1/1/2/0/69